MKPKKEMLDKEKTVMKMTIGRLALKEIQRRKLNFALGLVSVTMAVTALVGALTMLRAHDARTAKIVAEKEEETTRRMAILEDDYRKIMKILGFNLLILPEDQNLADLYENHVSSKYMPEEYATRLARANLMTLQHLLPCLQQRVHWNEKGRDIFLIGTRGEVTSGQGDPKEPILVAVPRGNMVVGFELHKNLNLRVGDRVKLLGSTFTVSQCNEERGTRDDITVWTDLKESQELLNRPGLINAILALKCLCAGNDIEQIRKDIVRLLPGTQVIEEGTKVITRTEARQRAAREAREAVDAEIRNRMRVRNEQEQFASILVPLVSIASGVWIALLLIANARERRSEIGILRAIGVSSKKIRNLFLIKAFVFGTGGAVLGFITGTVTGFLWERIPGLLSLDMRLFFIALVFALLLAMLGSWIPALWASQQDPARVMREE